MIVQIKLLKTAYYIKEFKFFCATNLTINKNKTIYYHSTFVYIIGMILLYLFFDDPSPNITKNHYLQ